MTLQDLETKWARAASENKVYEPYTPKFGRRRLGEKGIGRFSAAKLGDQLKVVTRTDGDSSQLVFPLDFRDFTDERDFNDMHINYRFGEPRAGFRCGTILELSELHDPWGKKEIRKVRSQLCSLIDPEAQDQSFQIRFDCPEFPDLSGLLENPISGKESHRIRFSINQDGLHEYEIQVGDRSTRKKEEREPLSCGPIEGVIRYYKGGLKTRERRLTDDAGEWHMGVKVYRDGCRVRPYGEEYDDWLQIRQRRARSGGKYYVLPQSVAGSIYISATENAVLQDATNREAGIIDSQAFIDFQGFVREQIDLLNHALEQETRSESQRQRRRTVRKILDTIVECLNRQQSDIYGDYVAKIDRSKTGDAGVTSKKPEVPSNDLKSPTKEEWHCTDCDATWRVLKGEKPTVCMELAVSRTGEPRNVQGCGSSNVERSKHEFRNGDRQLTSIISGAYALIGDRQIRPRVDYDMGENDDEYRVSEREIVINGNHPAYQVAEGLDGFTGKKYEIGDDVFVPALTTHITKCVCLAWAEFHYKKTERWEDFRARYEDLQASICEAVQRGMSNGKP
jgi:hypothetical protein